MKSIILMLNFIGKSFYYKILKTKKITIIPGTTAYLPPTKSEYKDPIIIKSETINKQNTIR